MGRANLGTQRASKHHILYNTTSDSPADHDAAIRSIPKVLPIIVTLSRASRTGHGSAPRIH